MDKHVKPNQIALAKIQKKTRKRSKQSNVATRVDRSKISKKADKTKSRTDLVSSGPASPIQSTANKPSKRRRRKSKVDEHDASKRHRKVQKCEEREESLLMLFDNMHTQAQRLNQMMSFFQTQLRDHRSILREEISEKLSNDKKSERSG
eukprot:jgi/Psemu1/305652/fgenesh1_kg.210_\